MKRSLAWICISAILASLVQPPPSFLRPRFSSLRERNHLSAVIHGGLVFKHFVRIAPRFYALFATTKSPGNRGSRWDRNAVSLWNSLRLLLSAIHSDTIQSASERRILYLYRRVLWRIYQKLTAFRVPSCFESFESSRASISIRISLFSIRFEEPRVSGYSFVRNIERLISRIISTKKDRENYEDSRWVKSFVPLFPKEEL